MNARTMMWSLTLGGAIPFLALSTYLWFSGGAALFTAFQALMIYAAIILTFVGAVRWGVALAGVESAPNAVSPFIFAVGPAIWSWAAVLSCPAFAASLGGAGLAACAGAMAFGFVITLIWDLRAVAAGVLPGWYRLFRITPSVAAVWSLLSAGVAAMR